MGPEVIEHLAGIGRRRALYEPAAAHAVDLRRHEVEQLLPHRDPFLFVERVTAVDLAQQSIAGRRRIDPSDPLFRGHFPGDPIYPGVLQIETMGQLGVCLFSLLRNGRASVAPEDRPQPVRGLKIHHAAFLQAVRPGDDLLIIAKAVDANQLTAICAGQLLKDGTVCSFAVMEVYFVEQ